MRMRLLLAMLVLAACSGENVATPGDAKTAQDLTIPPMDAGSAPVRAIEMPKAAPEPSGSPDEVDDYTSARDPRAKTPPGPSGALQSQLIALESELRGMASTTPSRPELLRVIANTYAELARADGSTSKAARTARSSSIANWETLIHDSPTFAKIDEAHYYRALAYEQNKDLSNARRSYYELIKSHPSSPFIPCAYFAFGEMFFDEAKNSDSSKYDLAKQAYQEVIKYPAPKNTCLALAKSKLADVKAAQGVP